MGLLRCLLNVGTRVVQMQRKERLSVSVAIQNNKKMFVPLKLHMKSL
jgi:hypothetical protein